MKKLLFVFLFFTVSTIASCQSFNLNDSIFHVGEVYNPYFFIAYHYDSDSILEKSFPTLDSIAEFLEKHPTIHIEIGVHVDARGSDKYSKRLDTPRAKSVKSYLVSKGISESRLVAKGYWNDYPIIPKQEIEKMKTAEEKEEAYQKNRRTEFKITKL